MKPSLVSLCALAMLAGCTGAGRLYPLNDAATRIGTPQFHFTRLGIGRGPVAVLMPDGEALEGEYRVITNMGMAFGSGPAGPVSMVAFGGGSPAYVAATGPKGTSMTCNVAVDMGGHGAGECEVTGGAHYRVMF